MIHLWTKLIYRSPTQLILMSVTWIVGNILFSFETWLAPYPCSPEEVCRAQPPPICPEGISQTDISDTNQTVSLTVEISEPYPSQALRPSTHEVKPPARLGYPNQEITHFFSEGKNDVDYKFHVIVLSSISCDLVR